MLAASRQYTSAHFRELLYVDNVAFFAVGFRRSTWERTGELDEGFGLGFFEDDDYCHRVRQAGMKIGIAEDVYVHHELSASFDKLPAGAKQAQFEKSRRRFEEKWGAWVPAPVPAGRGRGLKGAQGRHRDEAGWRGRYGGGSRTGEGDCEVPHRARLEGGIRDRASLRTRGLGLRHPVQRGIVAEHGAGERGLSA